MGWKEKLKPTKGKLVLAAAIFIVLVLGLPFFSLYTVSTSKSVYSPGEPVVISWSKLRFYECGCHSTSKPGIASFAFFKETKQGWEKVQHHIPYGFGAAVCVNGKLVSQPMPCDITTCRFPPEPLLKGKVTWDAKIYERKEEDEICESKSKYFKVEKPVPSYTVKTTPPGKYKVQYGTTEKVFEVR